MDGAGSAPGPAAACYIPNNPQYGLQLEYQWGLPNGQTPDGLGLNLSPPPACWPATPGDDMGSFSMPLDLDPLPSLFPFSPCSGNYKSETLGQGKDVKPTHDMADVLLSLKHAVVHPGQTGSGCASPGYGGGYPQQQLSYTVHPHQMLMSPGGYSTGFCDQLPPAGCQSHQAPPQPGTGPPIFPSMSVNVSMNMTYHPSAPPMSAYDCPQMQWSATPQTSSPGYVQNQGLLSPGYGGGATYSFTADFRPPTMQDIPLISTTSSFKPVLNGKTQFAPIRTRSKPHGYAGLSPGKLQMGLCPEDDSQRPNLCRICGKTYARPSTLKTHLRTHSGEKPYRCADCNKSFSQAANLTAHVRTHSGEKPFRCPICDRRFSQSSSVTTHMRTHSGERPYRCRMCKKAFSDSSTLTKHLRIHSGEKPYQCKLCLLRFSQSGNLNRHMRVHGAAAAGAALV